MVLALSACGDDGAAERAEQAFIDSVAAVRKIHIADSIAISEAMAVDTSIEILHVRYLDFEADDMLRIVVKDDSGNMRKYLVNPMMPAAEWKAIQKPANRGEWMLLELKTRELLPPNDSTPGEIVNEVVEMKMLEN